MTVGGRSTRQVGQQIGQVEMLKQSAVCVLTPSARTSSRRRVHSLTDANSPSPHVYNFTYTPGSVCNTYPSLGCPSCRVRCWYHALVNRNNYRGSRCNECIGCTRCTSSPHVERVGDFMTYASTDMFIQNIFGIIC